MSDEPKAEQVQEQPAPQPEAAPPATPPTTPESGAPQQQPRGPRPDRGPRPAGAGGDRPPRPAGGGDRGPRPAGAGGGDRGPRPAGAGGGDRGPRPTGGGGDRGPRTGGGDRGGDRGGRDNRFGPPQEIDLEKLINDSLYLDNQAHTAVVRMGNLDSGTKSQLRRLYNAVRRATRTPESERQHEFVMLRARLAYTIARHGLRSLDQLERLLLQVTRKNEVRGYERFRDLFEAIVAYNE